VWAFPLHNTIQYLDTQSYHSKTLTRYRLRRHRSAMHTAAVCMWVNTGTQSCHQVDSQAIENPELHSVLIKKLATNTKTQRTEQKTDTRLEIYSILIQSADGDTNLSVQPKHKTHANIQRHSITGCRKASPYLLPTQMPKALPRQWQCIQPRHQQ